jgi:hypothetical protein
MGVGSRRTQSQKRHPYAGCPSLGSPNLTCDGGGVKPGIFAIWFCPTECIADGLRILRGKQHAHNLTAVLIMLENFLANELTLAVAVGGEPNPLGGAQRRANCSELGSCVVSNSALPVVSPCDLASSTDAAEEVEHKLAKVGGEGSNPFASSNISIA